MNLGEFRQLTAHLPNACKLIVTEHFGRGLEIDFDSIKEVHVVPYGWVQPKENQKKELCVSLSCPDLGEIPD